MMAAHDEESRIAKCSTPTAFQAMLYSPVPTEPQNRHWTFHIPCSPHLRRTCASTLSRSSGLRSGGSRSRDISALLSQQASGHQGCSKFNCASRKSLSGTDASCRLG